MVRRQKVGIIVSDKLDKGIVITVDTRFKHRLYGKTMSKIKRYLAHDPENLGKVGDTVLIEEHPPISAKKRWILKTIVK